MEEVTPIRSEGAQDICNGDAVDDPGQDATVLYADRNFFVGGLGIVRTSRGDKLLVLPSDMKPENRRGDPDDDLVA